MIIELFPHWPRNWTVTGTEHIKWKGIQKFYSFTTVAGSVSYLMDSTSESLLILDLIITDDVYCFF